MPLATSNMAIDGLRGSINGIAYLPGTLEEVEEIRDAFEHRDIRPEMYTGSKGSERSFKQLSSRKTDVLHIATHGFYVSEYEQSKVANVTSSDMLSVSYEDLALFRSCILMAGVNNYIDSGCSATTEDGVLTAYEISEMDLHSTNLVVLSACETGLGEISGDGIFGLPRGFKKAGASSILMTLWQVDDAATKELMINFYENFLSGVSKRLSLLKAQQAVRSHKEKGWDDPKYWAAFILLDAF
jgi:CHAT domain-containing protein